MIEAFGAVAVANSIAYLSELLRSHQHRAGTDAPHPDEAVAANTFSLVKAKPDCWSIPSWCAIGRRPTESPGSR